MVVVVVEGVGVVVVAVVRVVVVVVVVVEVEEASRSKQDTIEHLLELHKAFQGVSCSKGQPENLFPNWSSEGLVSAAVTGQVEATLSLNKKESWWREEKGFKNMFHCGS